MSLSLNERRPRRTLARENPGARALSCSTVSNALRMHCVRRRKARIKFDGSLKMLDRFREFLRVTVIVKRQPTLIEHPRIDALR